MNASSRGIDANRGGNLPHPWPVHDERSSRLPFHFEANCRHAALPHIRIPTPMFLSTPSPDPGARRVTHAPLP